MTTREKLQPPRQSLDQYLTPIDVANATNVSLSTVYKLVHSGLIASTRILGSIRIRRQDAEAYLAKNSTAPLASAPGGQRQDD